MRTSGRNMPVDAAWGKFRQKPVMKKAQFRAPPKNGEWPHFYRRFFVLNHEKAPNFLIGYFSPYLRLKLHPINCLITTKGRVPQVPLLGPGFGTWVWDLGLGLGIPNGFKTGSFRGWS